MARIVLALTLVVITAEAFLTSSDDKYLSVDHNGPSSRGTDFYVAFLTNADAVIQSKPLYQIFISTDEPEPVTFTVSLNENLPAEMREGFPLTTTVSHGEVVTLTLHQRMAVLTGRNLIERSKAIRVRTEGGKKVSVQGFNDNVRTSDGFVALPCDAMRTETFRRYEYFVLAADQNASPDDPKKSSLALIVPCDNDTEITVEPSQLVTFVGFDELPSRPTSFQAGPGGSASASTFTANAGQTLLITHPNDLSGTIIQSNNPIVLLTGHECGEIPIDVTACDHMVDQMPPGLSLGTTFFLVPIAARVSGDLFRVGSLTDGTKVTVTCVTSATDTPKELSLEKDGTIDRGSYLTFQTPGNTTENQPNWKPNYCCLDATQPVVVAQYSLGYSYDRSLIGKPNNELGDPFMSIVPPLTQYLNNYTMKSLTGVSGPFPFRYVSLSIAATFFDNSVSDQQKIKVNDTAVKTLDGWIPMYCSNNQLCGYGAQVEVPGGEIRVYHEDPDVGLGLLYYAYQQQNSYSLPPGYELTPISATRVILENIEVLENVGMVRINVSRLGDLSVSSEGTLIPRPTSPVQANFSDYVAFDPVNLLYPGGTREDLVTFFIEIIDDEIQEPLRESFEIVGVATRNLYFPFPVMTVTIIDDDGGEATVSISPLSYEVVEKAGTVNIVVTKTGNFSANIEGTLTTVQTASASYISDYTNGTYPVVIQEDQAEVTISIPIIDDQIVELLRERFSVSLSLQPQYGLRLENSVASVTIVDDDDLAVHLEPASQTVVEGSVASFTVVALGQSDLSFSVLFMTLDGTAAAPGDYTAFNTTITREQLQSPHQVTIQIEDDSILETRESFQAQLQLTQESVDLRVIRLELSIGDVAITDNDVVEIGFNPTLYSVNEDSRVVVFTVENRNADLEREVTVQFATIEASATDGGDYVGKVENITFLAGETQKTVEVMIINDSVYEGLQEFSARLTTTDGGVNIFEPIANVRITDNDEITIQFNPTSYTVTEGGSTQLVIQKIGTAEQPVTVSLSTQEGTAVESDFVSIVGLDVTFSTDESEKRIVVQTNSDVMVEATERFSAIITSTSDRVVVLVDKADINILETSIVVVEFQPSSYTVNEVEGVVKFSIVKKTQTTEEVVVLFTTVDGSAIAPSDYTALVSSEVTFSAEETVKVVEVTIQQDGVSEGVEIFTASLSLLPGDIVVQIGDQAQATTTIRDSDVVEIGFNPILYSVKESSGVVVFIVENRNADLEREVTVQFTTIEASATAGLDFIASSGELTFHPGNTEKRFEVTIINDIMFEGLQVFSAELTTNDSRVDIFQTVATVQIIDTDRITIQFNPTSYTVTEGGSAQLIIQMIGTAEQPVTVSLSTQVGTAGVSDFTSVSDVLVTFAPGESQKTVTVVTTVDSVVEGIELFSAIITSTSVSVTITDETASITILETGNVVVEFQPNFYRVNEAAGAVTFTIVKRSQTTERVVVRFLTQDGSATSLSDYISVVNVVLFEASEEVKEVQVIILQDDVVEGIEVFTARLLTQDGATGVTIGGNGVATTTIEDDDMLIVSRQETSYTVKEDGGEVVVCLSTSKGTDMPIALLISTSPGNNPATVDVDYSSPSEVVIPVSSGPSMFCFNIVIIDDRVAFEGDEEVLVSFEIATGSEAQVEGSFSILILDNDEVMVRVSPGEIVVTESQTSVEVCVEADGELEIGKQIVTSLSTRSITAIADLDYVPAEVNISISAVGHSSNLVTDRCLVVTLIDDSVDERDEQFLVFISKVHVGSGVRIEEPLQSTITVVDNDVPVVRFVETEYTVSEGDGEVEVCLMIDGEISFSIVVRLFATPGTAEAGLDYIPGIMNLVTFQPPGDSVVCTRFEIIDDMIALENNETFVVHFGNNQTTVTILDNDVLTVVTPSKDTRVPEDSGDLEICLRKDKDTAREFSVAVFFTEVSTENAATAGADCTATNTSITFAPLATNTSITFAPLDREACVTVGIIDDTLPIEVHESFIVFFECDDGIQLTSVTIIDNDGATVNNDTISGDPLFTVPVLGGSELCYDIRGEAGIFLNLVSDKCTSVNADYEPMDVAENGNIIRAVGIRAVGSDRNCHNIEVRMVPSDGDNSVTSFIDGTEISGILERDGIRLRAYSDRVRISVPNCEFIDLIMWVITEEENGQDMLRLQISRGYNLAPTSHGLIGQFWNVPVSIERYSGPVKEEYADIADQGRLYLITVFPGTESKPRSFLGEWYSIAWDRKSGPCYYAGDSEGGKSGDYGSVIEGKYTDYQVAGLFSHDYMYSQFEEDRCTQNVE